MSVIYLTIVFFSASITFNWIIFLVLLFLDGTGTTKLNKNGEEVSEEEDDEDDSVSSYIDYESSDNYEPSKENIDQPEEPLVKHKTKDPNVSYFGPFQMTKVSDKDKEE